MQQKPKPLFWIVVAAAVLGLTAFGLYRAGLLPGGPPAGGPGALAPTPSPEGTVEILFVSSSAKKSWVDAMVKQFNAAGHRVGRKTIVVKASHGNSGSSSTS